MDLAGRIGVLRELRLPARGGVGGAKGARLPGEGRDECLAADLELGGPTRKGVGQGADGGGIISGLAWEGAGKMMSAGVRKRVAICERLPPTRTSCQRRRRA